MRLPQILGRLAALLAAALLSSCGIRLPIQTKGAPSNSPPQTRVEARDPDVLVWLTADKYHTGMTFPYDWLLESGFVPPAGIGSARYVTMSWGNRDAYSEQGIDTKWKLFRVLFTPTASVMEVIPSNWNVAEVLPHQRIYRKLVPRDSGPALAKFLNECCATGPDGKPIVLCASSWGKGVQLQSRHSYYIPRVCNIWTLQTIECLGGDIRPWFALTADGLIRQAEKPPNNFEQIWPGGGIPPKLE